MLLIPRVQKGASISKRWGTKAGVQTHACRILASRWHQHRAFLQRKGFRLCTEKARKELRSEEAWRIHHLEVPRFWTVLSSSELWSTPDILQALISAEMSPPAGTDK
ncbi:hypothetical protein MHYP_G00097880 [Metynnis hypsauchen]